MKKAFLIALAGLMLMACTDYDSGIKRRLPPPAKEQDEDFTIKERNVMHVFVSADNRLSVSYGEGEDKEIELTDLSDAAKRFMTPRPNDETAPEVGTKTFDLVGDVLMSKGVISLENDRGTSYDMYLSVQNELARAFNEMKEELAWQKFHKHLDQLTEEQTKAINEAVPVRISEAEPL